MRAGRFCALAEYRQNEVLGWTREITPAQQLPPITDTLNTHRSSEPTRKENTVKKSIAVLSLSLAATLGLAACSPTNIKAPAESQSASASASASATASASASATASASVSSESKASASATGSASASSDSSSDTKGTDSSSSDNTAVRIGKQRYNVFKKGAEQAKKDPNAKKSTNADGTVYTNTKEGASIVEAKNGDYILIRDDGGWIRVSPDGSLSSVSESGDWSVIKTNGDTIAVDENGEATITNVVTGEYSQDYKSLELPKPPAPVDGYSTAPKEGVKPTSAKTHE